MMRRSSSKNRRLPRLAAMLILFGALGVAAAVANNFVWVWAERNPLRPEMIVLRAGILTIARSDPHRDPRVPSLPQTWTWHRGGEPSPVWIEQMHMSYRNIWLWPIPAVTAIAGLTILARVHRSKQHRDQGVARV